MKKKWITILEGQSSDAANVVGNEKLFETLCCNFDKMMSHHRRGLGLFLWSADNATFKEDSWKNINK